MVFFVILLTLLAVHVAPSHGQTTTPVPFVSGPVKCTSVAVQFAVDPNNLSFKKLNDYTGFVGVFADHADPKCADVPVSIMTSLGGDYEISISFSDCNISIAALYGAQQRLLEYSATIHARLSPIDFLGAGSYSLNASYANLTFPITCNWKTGALVSNNATITNNDPQPPPPVGNTTSPVGQLNMTLRDANGNDLNNVEAGTRVRVIIELNGDSYYNSELPEFCSVSNALNPMGTYIAVIADFCPYEDTITNSPFDFKAYQQDNRTYFFDFDAFLFDNQQTTLLISCYIQVCMNFTDCTRTCWPAGTAKERFIAAMSNRHSYRQTPVQFNGDIPSVANSSHGHNLTVTPRSSEVTTIVPTTTNGGLPDWALVLIILFVVFLILSLLLCFCCCVCCGVGLGLWSRRYGQHRDRRTEYIYPQTTSMPATFAADNASVHHMEIPKVNLNGSSGARSITSDKSYKY